MHPYIHSTGNQSTDFVTKLTKQRRSTGSTGSRQPHPGTFMQPTSMSPMTHWTTLMLESPSFQPLPLRGSNTWPSKIEIKLRCWPKPSSHPPSCVSYSNHSLPKAASSLRHLLPHQHSINDSETQAIQSTRGRWFSERCASEMHKPNHQLHLFHT